MANGNLLYEPGLKQGLCGRLKGVMGRKMGVRSRREGTWVYLMTVDIWQKTAKSCKVVILQLKNLKKEYMSTRRFACKYL